MSREILFRGKFGNEWKYGYLSVEPKGFVIKEPYKLNQSNIWHIDLDTVGQYTGLTDKNDKKIFEGDILKSLVKGHDNVSLKKTYWSVEYKERYTQGNGYYIYGVNRRWNRMLTQSMIWNCKCEVIGNIYDNPELLEVS